METVLNIEAKNEADLYRKKLIADLPIKECYLQAGGISTSYLVGGEGPPIVLLHGPGESSLWWMRVIPNLVENFKVMIPDLPGHGSTTAPDNKISEDNILVWLDEFLQITCKTPCILIGHVVGGAIAARYAIQPNKKLKHLVLVDSLGLSTFRPSPMFAYKFLRFMVNPTNKTYLRFLPQCIYDLEELKRAMGKYWEPFFSYNLLCAKNPEKKLAVREIMNAMSGKVPDHELEKLNFPVSLIWGRYDKANSLKIAEKAHEKFGWPLYIIEDTRDDPKIEKPDDFVAAIHSSVGA